MYPPVSTSPTSTPDTFFDLFTVSGTWPAKRHKPEAHGKFFLDFLPEKVDNELDDLICEQIEEEKLQAKIKDECLTEDSSANESKPSQKRGKKVKKEASPDFFTTSSTSRKQERTGENEDYLNIRFASPIKNTNKEPANSLQSDYETPLYHEFFHVKKPKHTDHETTIAETPSKKKKPAEGRKSLLGNNTEDVAKEKKKKRAEDIHSSDNNQPAIGDKSDNVEENYTDEVYKEKRKSLLENNTEDMPKEKKKKRTEERHSSDNNQPALDVKSEENNTENVHKENRKKRAEERHSTGDIQQAINGGTNTEDVHREKKKKCAEERHSSDDNEAPIGHKSDNVEQNNTENVHKEKRKKRAQERHSFEDIQQLINEDVNNTEDVHKEKKKKRAEDRHSTDNNQPAISDKHDSVEETHKKTKRKEEARRLSLRKSQQGHDENVETHKKTKSTEEENRRHSLRKSQQSQDEDNAETQKKTKRKEDENRRLSLRKSQQTDDEDIIEPTQDVDIVKKKRRKSLKPKSTGKEKIPYDLVNQMIRKNGNIHKETAPEMSPPPPSQKESSPELLMQMLDKKKAEMEANELELYQKNQEDEELKINGTAPARNLRKRNSNVDNVYNLLDKIEAEEFEDVVEHDRSLTDQQIEILQSLRVNVPPGVAPLHRIETRIGGHPTEAQKKEMENLGLPIKRGFFNKAEDEKIRQNWASFCQEHDLPDDPTPFLHLNLGIGSLLPLKERVKFVKYIAQGLNDRMLQSVYNRFRKIMTNLVHGRFTPEEDRAILEYIGKSTSSRPYVDLSVYLKRNRVAIERRFKALTAPEQKRIEWSQENINKLLKAILKVTGCKGTSELEHRKIDCQEWRKIAIKMGNVPPKRLKRKFYYDVYPRMFIPKRVTMDQVKHRLVHILIENEEDDWKTIPWKQITEHFPGFTFERLTVMFHDLVRVHVPKEIKHDLKATLLYLNDVTFFKTKEMKRLKVPILDA